MNRYISSASLFLNLVVKSYISSAQLPPDLVMNSYSSSARLFPNLVTNNYIGLECLTSFEFCNEKLQQTRVLDFSRILIKDPIWSVWPFTNLVHPPTGWRLGSHIIMFQTCQVDGVKRILQPVNWMAIGPIRLFFTRSCMLVIEMHRQVCHWTPPLRSSACSCGIPPRAGRRSSRPLSRDGGVRPCAHR